MQRTKDTLKEARIAAKFSQPVLVESLGVHFRTVQNRKKVVPLFLRINNIQSISHNK